MGVIGADIDTGPWVASDCKLYGAQKYGEKMKGMASPQQRFIAIDASGQPAVPPLKHVALHSFRAR